MTKAYIVKDTTSGKYISKKDWYCPTLGKLPILFLDRDLAQEQVMIFNERVQNTVQYENKWLAGQLKELQKASYKLAEANADLCAAEQAGVAKFIKLAQGDVQLRESQLKCVKQNIASELASMAKVKKAAEAVLVIHTIELP